MPPRPTEAKFVSLKSAAAWPPISGSWRAKGFSAFGVDGSPTAIERGQERLATEGVEADLRVADAEHIADLFPAASFDAVVDVGCLQCNTVLSAVRIVEGMGQLLKPGGRIFSLLLADESFGNGRGRYVEDGTFDAIPDGPLKDRGLQHFYTFAETKKLFQAFSPLSIESQTRTFNERTESYKLWIASGARPAQI